jgi:FkbM family methyltransferase
MSIYSNTNSKGIPIQTILDTLFEQKTHGTFVELGAYDGLFQSNTAYLEFERGWTGVLIEPSPDKFQQCVRNRPNSQCFSYACVSFSYPNQTIQGDFYDSPMASAYNIRDSNRPMIEVPAKPLGEILSLANLTKSIDLLSIDVEGYELYVLQGLDFSIHRPKYILIELYEHSIESVHEYLTVHRYTLIANLSNYNEYDNPEWDGDHNDYLYIDNAELEHFRHIVWPKLIHM